MMFCGTDVVNQLTKDRHMAFPTPYACPIIWAKTCTWQKVREELAEFHTTSELPQRLTKYT